MSLVLLEILLRWQSWRVYRAVAADDAMQRFYVLAGVTLAVEAVVALEIAGAFRPLSAL